MSSLTDTHLFDTELFEQTLAASSSPLEAYREALKLGAERLQTLFEQGETAGILVTARAQLMDELLRRAWLHNLPDQANAALIAVGGYGRGELHPASDIDLMILLQAGEQDSLREPIENLLMFLWDIGLEVGHSVRTIDDCIQEASKDITVATNLMEARILMGSEALFNDMLNATGPDNIWPDREFFEAKLQEQQQRHARHHDTSSNLEPNIKSSPGGLRDIQMIGWVAKRHFGARTLHDLMLNGFLTGKEYETLMDCQEFLWKIRFALHTLNGRREDRLLFDSQQALAKQFGYEDEDNTLGVERFMRDYYLTAIKVDRLNESLLQLFQEAILHEQPLPAPVPLNEHFQVQTDFIEVTKGNVFVRNPTTLLEIFLVMAQHPEIKGIRANTIRLIRSHRYLIDDDFRKNPEACRIFMEILRQPKGITHQLRRMNRYGILATYIPAFSHIVGRMQYDLFHVYTVDQHTLFVIRNLRRFAIPEHSHEFPLCSEIIQSLHKPELLYLAALFHDISKGQGGDHSSLGSKEAWNFCIQHGLSEYDSRLVSSLVKQHLIMSITAQRQDISDPDIVQIFAQKVGDMVMLDYLYLLTIADIRATDPKLWNSWKGALLKDLYSATRRALIRGLETPQAEDELIQEKQIEALRLLRNEGISKTDAIDLWRTLDMEYFLHNSPNSITWQTKTILDAKDQTPPLITVRTQASRGGTEVMHYGPDHDQQFAITTSVLDQLGLNIMDARILTTDGGYALNSYTVLGQDGKPVEESEHKSEIIDILQKRLNDAGNIDIRVSRRMPRQQSHFNRRTELTFSTDPTNQRTIMQLDAQDRPGLLAEVGYAFASCGVRLHQAKIATIGAEVEDIFYITDITNHILQDAEQFECLRTMLTTRLTEDSQEKT